MSRRRRAIRWTWCATPTTPSSPERTRRSSTTPAAPSRPRCPGPSSCCIRSWRAEPARTDGCGQSLGGCPHLDAGDDADLVEHTRADRLEDLDGRLRQLAVAAELAAAHLRLVAERDGRAAVDDLHPERAHPRRGDGGHERIGGLDADLLAAHERTRAHQGSG